MEAVREINEELAITGQPTPDKLLQLVEKGYRSVVNLRSPTEVGFWDDEQQTIEQLGIHYANFPIHTDSLTPNFLLQLIQKFAALPRPILIHCDSGVRSSVIAFVQIAIKQGMSVEDALHTAVPLLRRGIHQQISLSQIPVY